MAGTIWARRMVIDTSALFAIVLDEPEAALFLDLLLQPRRPIISAGTMIEIAAVATRRFGRRLDGRLDHALASIAPETVAVTPAHATIGRDAYHRFGLGTGHPAKLNFGDCFAYALAKATGEPLLFKGEDFSKTDITPAI